MLAKGLSLIEVVIVLALSMAIAATVIPKVLGSRIAVNEAKAITNLRVIASAQESYKAAYPYVGYADHISDLSLDFSQPQCKPTTEHACLIDWTFVKSTNDGYSYKLALAERHSKIPHTSYMVAATPIMVHKDGNRTFCAVEDGKVRYAMAHRKPAASTTWSDCRALPILP